MDEPIRKLTPEEIRAQYKKAARKWDGRTAQIFDSDAALNRHLQEVAEAQAHGAPF